MPPHALNSSFRGFLLPGTGIPFTEDLDSLGFDASYWDSHPYGGQQLDDLMQQVVSGVTGLRGDLVRPRWQVEPPNAPPITHTEAASNLPVERCWAAVGVTTSTPLGFPANTEIAQPGATCDSDNANGFQQQSDQEEFDVLTSFYGRDADRYAVALRAGLMVAQNREVMQILGIGLVNTSGRTRVPTLTQGQWWMRVDITVTFRREVREYYPVLYFLSAHGTLTTDTGLVDPFAAACDAD